MRFFVLSTLVGDATAFLPAEGRRVAELLHQGVFLQAWMRSDQRGAVVLAEAPSEAALRDVLATMPTVAHGAATYELVRVEGPPSA